MSLDNSAVVPALPTGGYQIDQSLRFNDNDSAYLYRTPSSAATNRKKWTFSAWVKRNNISLGSSTYLFSTANNGIGFDTDDVLFVTRNGVGSVETLAKLRDTGSWYHIVIAVDTTLGSASDRVKIYLNGELQSTNGGNPFSQNYDTEINHTVKHAVGRSEIHGGRYADVYMAEVHEIDGQQLDSSYFGETDEDYGHWKPKKYSGSYGTNGFYLDFDGTYNNDKSGNGNNFTATNLATTDVVLDSPTNNFCTLNKNNPSPYDSPNSATLSEGNLKLQGGTYGGTSNGYHGTIGMNGGKWYWETTMNVDLGTYGAGDYRVGCHTHDLDGLFYDNTYWWESYSYHLEMNIQNNERRIKHHNVGGGYNIDSAYGTGVAGDVQMFAVDLENGQMWFGKNGTWYNSQNPETGANCYIQSSELLDTNKTYLPFVAKYESNSYYIYVNFGQDSSFSGYKTSGSGNYTDGNGQGDFYYEPPSGYLALCSKNLPDPAAIPSENFNTVLYTGNASTQNITTGFATDFVWLKSRSNGGYWHELHDNVRGTQKRLFSNATSAEDTTANTLTSFNSDGFTLGSYPGANASGGSYVAWNWKANGSSSSNTNGSITSTVSANQDAGFSIVSYSGNSTNGATVGHGLSSAPEFITIKSRSRGDEGWWTQHKDLSSGQHYLRLDNTSSQSNAGGNIFNDFPTSSVLKLQDGRGVNQTGETYIAYCFHSVDDFSKAGVYKGNGSTNGAFMFTGFRPAFIIIKRTDASHSWRMFDSKRNDYNTQGNYLTPDSSGAEGDTLLIDFLSNGFKIRSNNDGINGTNSPHIYIAFAEHPFKYTNAK